MGETWKINLDAIGKTIEAAKEKAIQFTERNSKNSEEARSKIGNLQIHLETGMSLNLA